MKIVSINEARSVCDEDGGIRKTTKDLGSIIDNIDDVAGHSHKIRAYIYALRDLQYEYNQSSYEINDGHRCRPRAARQGL